ncbi:DUF2000 domain-containing protein [Motiliproteus sp. MSK22-1]|uniref:DUF2000 domain-containing protein n=1 Tax=Motiliproteus sp. MSK22-1 TaxID=1897630 RepID=UPI000977C2E1|nr:DUF2000 domain-containing protein [Motiliproteus sp. MSK22-1]OMH33878.1 hypothetical protein BGP75_12925 [Motiliproteus sp. MSK22-1]
METRKCVIVIDQALSSGPIANTAAVLSLSLGRKFPELIGQDLTDNQGDRHHGITTAAIPVLKGSGPLLKEMREALKAHEAELTVIDLTRDTQTTRNYQEYANKLESTPLEQLEYQGVAIYGNKKLVNKFTGNLGLLR